MKLIKNIQDLQKKFPCVKSYLFVFYQFPQFLIKFLKLKLKGNKNPTFTFFKTDSIPLFSK